MLDLSKLESGTLPLNMIQDDIVKYLKYLTESFHSYAETKRYSPTSVLPEVKELYMDFDPEKDPGHFFQFVRPMRSSLHQREGMFILK